ncbi:hypothetical protein LTR96_002435 [Exophiala xenobiotica]|nr:hypothetical protein LTR96_002435 [Exophiala xenobiotica]
MVYRAILPSGSRPQDKDPYDDKDDPYSDEHGKRPEPWRNGEGASIIGARNLAREMQSPDMVRPDLLPLTMTPCQTWSGASPTPIHAWRKGDWARQTTVRELPTSIEVAGVNMRLDGGAIRELHRHKEGEWAYVLEGKVRVTALDREGGNYIGEVEKKATYVALQEYSALRLRSSTRIPAKERYIFQGSLPGSMAEEDPKKPRSEEVQARVYAQDDRAETREARRWRDGADHGHVEFSPSARWLRRHMSQFLLSWWSSRDALASEC